jgi:AcrR family transcriptional regulator
MVTTTMARTNKKQRIVAAAEKLWRQAHNVSKVSLTDIAQEAGVSPTTIYNYFSTREGLVHEVVRHLFDRVIGKQKAFMESDLPFPQKIQGMISAKMGGIRGMETDLIDKICTDPYSKRLVEEMSEKHVKPIIQSLIRKGKEQGYIRPDMTEDVLTLYFDMLKSGGIACTEAMKQIITDKEKTLALTKLIYFGIFQKEFEISLDGTEKR